MPRGCIGNLPFRKRVGGQVLNASIHFEHAFSFVCRIGIVLELVVGAVEGGWEVRKRGVRVVWRTDHGCHCNGW